MRPVPETNPLTLIEKRSLPVSMRGYDRKATDEPFERLAATTKALVAERDAARARADELESRAAAVQQREQEITEALLVASRVRSESERDAKESAERLIGEAQERATAFEQEARNVEQLALRVRQELVDYLESLLGKIERHDADFGSIVEELMQRTSGVSSSARVEPVAGTADDGPTAKS
jgi:cell division septum initiation protein DivIVA